MVLPKHSQLTEDADCVCFYFLTVGVAPVLLEPLQDIAVVAPNDAILECDIDMGEPEAEIKW